MHSKHPSTVQHRKGCTKKKDCHLNVKYTGNDDGKVKCCTYLCHSCNNKSGITYAMSLRKWNTLQKKISLQLQPKGGFKSPSKVEISSPTDCYCVHYGRYVSWYAVPSKICFSKSLNFQFSARQRYRFKYSSHLTTCWTMVTWTRLTATGGGCISVDFTNIWPGSTSTFSSNFQFSVFCVLRNSCELSLLLCNLTPHIKQITCIMACFFGSVVLRGSSSLVSVTYFSITVCTCSYSRWHGHVRNLRKKIAFVNSGPLPLNNNSIRWNVPMSLALAFCWIRRWTI